jgi:hypothetical protein
MRAESRVSGGVEGKTRSVTQETRNKKQETRNKRRQSNRNNPRQGRERSSAKGSHLEVYNADGHPREASQRASNAGRGGQAATSSPIDDGHDHGVRCWLRDVTTCTHTHKADSRPQRHER